MANKPVKKFDGNVEIQLAESYQQLVEQNDSQSDVQNSAIRLNDQSGSPQTFEKAFQEFNEKKIGMSERDKSKNPTFLSEYRHKFSNPKKGRGGIESVFDKDTQQKTGQQVVYEMMDKFKSNYLKKFPFEKGMFHQCLPNPQKPEEYITV